MSPALVAIVACAVCVTAKNYGDDNAESTAFRYLTRYGYLNTQNNEAISAADSKQALHDALVLFQQYYRLAGKKGELNNITLEYMNKPRCGMRDFPYEMTTESIKHVWPKKHLKWNFHMGTVKHLKAAQAAFQLWEANSTLTFERVIDNPDILISFREGQHVMARNGEQCSSKLDGPGGVLGHAYYPTGQRDYVSEVHIDRTEPWHILLSKTLPEKTNLVYVLTHEIGHTLGLRHSDLQDSIMYAFAIDNPPFPTKLSLEDVLNIQQLYNANETDNDDGDDYWTTSVPSTTTVASSNDVPTDPCELRSVDSILIMNKRMYIAHERYVWPIDVKGKTYEKPLRLRDFLRFLPENFTHLSGVYQKPSGDLVLFVDNLVYMAAYPSFELVQNWPKRYSDFGIPPDARINAALNTNRGKSFVIYNGHAVGEIDDCVTRVMRHLSIESVFPGIPSGVSSGFRYIDGNLYFINKERQQFYIYNEFTETVTTAGKFDLGIVGVTCPRDGLLRQLQDLLNRFVRISADIKRKE